MIFKKKPSSSVGNKGKNYQVYWWIILIGILLMILAWLYFEKNNPLDEQLQLSKILS